MKNNRIKLVIIVEATVGGIRKHIYDLITNLDNAKYEITLIYSTIRSDQVFLNNLTALKQKGINLVEMEMVRNINPISDFNAFLKLRSYLKNINPDIIHLHAAKAGTLGRLAALSLRKRNVVYTPHGGSFHKFNEGLGLIYKFIERFFAFNFVHFIAVSKHAQSQYKELLKLNDSQNHLVYNGISLDRPESMDIKKIREEFGCDDTDLIAVIPAVFYEAKGHLQFLQALQNYGNKLNPKVKILLAGDGPLRNEIENKIASLKLNEQIKVLGFINDMHAIFSICDIVLLPSQNEVFGYVLLEAMLYSKPVFAASVDAIPELITHRLNGELFQHDRLIDIFNRLNYFTEHKTELNEMGKKGFENLKDQFSLKQMVKKTEAIYLKVLSNEN